MPSLTFYPLGNADCCLIKLDQRMVLLDYAAVRDPEAEDDRRIDLPAALQEDIGWPERKAIDVVAFTHLDDDHIRGASDFFYLEHADKYQSEERVKIGELWVPAAAIVEEGTEDEARVIRAEARHRLREGRGIRVFSRPAHLKDWFEKEGIDFESRARLITDAGQLVPGFDKETDGVEFFVHSPFAERDGDQVLDRNEHSLVFQAVFKVGDTKVLLAADTVCENWDKIVKVTRLKKRPERLEWDVFKLPHHCSYLSLAPEKGKTETTPLPNVQWLLEQGRSRSTMVSTSWSVVDEDQDQPPHFQARNRYKRVLAPKSGKFVVTMDHPTPMDPKRLVINLTGAGAAVSTPAAIGTSTLFSTQAPRVGRSG